MTTKLLIRSALAAATLCFVLSGCGSHDQPNAAPPPDIHPSSMTPAQRQQIESELHNGKPSAPAPAAGR